MNELETKLFGDLGAWIEQHVSVRKTGEDKHSKAINKADLLEHLLARYRLKQKRLDNSVSFEDAFNWECYADEEQLIFSSSDKPTSPLSKGTCPSNLQVPLLSYLVSQHGKRETIYQTIEGFIKREWDNFLPEDFKKTRTGVYRCFTNTRFAAKKLREVGLIKYGQGEAFKTWELSFMGVLVAAYSREWIGLYPIKKGWNTDIHLCISQRIGTLHNSAWSESFLRDRCRPMVDHYESYQWMFDMLSNLLVTYREGLSKQELPNHMNTKLTMEMLAQFEQAQGFDSFLYDFIEHLEIDRLLNGLC